MKNIYGEQVQLTKAQAAVYRQLLSGSVFVERTARQYRTFEALKDKGLVKVVWAYPNGCRFERWM